MDSWKLEAVRPWMQFLELVGTLSRGEDENTCSGRFGPEKNVVFLFVLMKSFIFLQKLPFDYPSLTSQKIKTNLWIEWGEMGGSITFSLPLRHAEGRVEVVQLEPMVEDVRNLRDLMAKNGTFNA